METIQPDRRYDASPQDALSQLASFDGVALIDFDETLYLRNSTEDFIDTARPATLVVVALTALEFVKPWRLTGCATRDSWRIWLVFLLCPWIMRLWRRRVEGLASTHANVLLVAQVRERQGETVILSAGYGPIIAPLAEAMSLGELKLVAARVRSLRDRQQGKLRLAADQLGEDVGRSLVLTDSLQDTPLLSVSARPLRVVWPEAYFRPALSHVYVPGRYITRIKRPGTKYIRRGILQEDFVVWILCAAPLLSMPLQTVVGLFFLLVSFWAVYEAGYVDNDRVAERHEAEPKLSPAYWTAEVSTSAGSVWVWAVLAGAVGLSVISGGVPKVSTLLTWVALLVVTTVWFRTYNRMQKSTRIWLYIGLQALRTTAFAVAVPVVPIASAVLGAQILTKWFPYLLYRSANSAWPELPLHLVRLVMFLVLGSLLVLDRSPGVLLDLHFVAAFAYFSFVARREVRSMITAAGRIDRSSQIE